LLLEPLRLTLDVQVTHSLSLTGLVLFRLSAPRLVLMRCMTRCEVVVV